MFVLPDQLPATVAELNDLADQARKSINVIQARHDAGETLSPEDVTALEGLLEAVDTINSAAAEASTAEQEHQARVDAALARANPAPAADADVDDEPADDADADADVEVVDAEIVEDEAALVAAGKGGKKSKPSFAGLGDPNPDNLPAVEMKPGWEMVPGAPGFKNGKVGFAELALAIDSVKRGRTARSNRPAVGEFAAQALAQLKRGTEAAIVENSHDLLAAIERATDQTKLPGGSLIAAGGWCAPSEQLYNFCDVPDAVDLISLPEITITRGGVRWPQEPDLTSIFDSFQFFFTEPELEATDGGGNPTAVKNCVVIPCPAEFEEIRLNVVGYCVEAGILQTQGWPELITWFMQNLVAEHLRAISRRTILDMVAGSGAPKVISQTTTIGSVSSVLNSLALQATNLRLNKGLSRTATIEGVAPSWFFEVLRADLAMQEGTDTKAVTDGEISGWLSARNIALQFVGDWQTRGTNLPGNLATLRWPGHVDVMLYPAGTWFRSLSNVIELGVLYPKEQLQVNRYTRFFTEDAIAVGKRCYQSILVRIPLANDGAIGARTALTYADTTPGTTFVPVDPTDDAPIADRRIAITGAPTGGTFTITWNGVVSAAIPFNATSEAVYTALANINGGFLDSEVQVDGGALPGTPIEIRRLTGTLAVTGSLTGGTSPAVTVTTIAS